MKTLRGVDGGDSEGVLLCGVHGASIVPRVARVSVTKAHKLTILLEMIMLAAGRRSMHSTMQCSCVPIPLSSIVVKVAHTTPLHVMKLFKNSQLRHSASKHHIKYYYTHLSHI
jgi:hypothetical protein